MESNLNSTPSANRVRIGFFGSRNAGKSSVVNAFSGQEVSIVSETLGTTTDPVVKSMELLPLGPVTLVDTAGLDDEGDLGAERVKKTRAELERCDVALLIIDAEKGMSEAEKNLEKSFEQKKVPFLTVYNKCDLKKVDDNRPNVICVSAKTGENIQKLKETVAAIAKNSALQSGLFDGKLKQDDVIVFVTPIDSSAPKGRMILPQVRALRDALDKKAIVVFCQTEQLSATLASLKNPPCLVVTDSQVFGRVKEIVPQSVPLTSFSILLAHVNGILETAVKGAVKLSQLKDSDVVLISEGCTHHRQCEDIGTVKLPTWIKQFTKAAPSFRFTSGGTFPEELEGITLVLHCGGCMLTQKEMARRMKIAGGENIPFCNYGIAIAHMNGILKRSLEIFPELAKLV